jgi:hypothetical protein
MKSLPHFVVILANIIAVGSIQLCFEVFAFYTALFAGFGLYTVPVKNVIAEYILLGNDQGRVKKCEVLAKNVFAKAGNRAQDGVLG